MPGDSFRVYRRSRATGTVETRDVSKEGLAQALG